MACERNVHKVAIIAMIVGDDNAVALQELFEGFIGCNCFLQQKVLHQTNILEAEEMVNEHSCSNLTLIGKLTL